MTAMFKTVLQFILERQTVRLLRKYEPKVIAITGSYGKTTTKHAVAKVLEQQYRVLYHEGNYNSEIGLPMSVFSRQVPQPLWNVFAWIGILIKNEAKIAQGFEYEVIVLEMGADHPGDIDHFTKYIKPDIGIVTAVAPVHVEMFSTVESILEEKWLVADRSDIALINCDNSLLADKNRSTGRGALTYGYGSADYQIVRHAFNPKSLTTDLEISLPDNNRIMVSTHVVGKHAMYSIAAAVAVGVLCEVAQHDIRQGIEGVVSTAGRMQILRGKNNVTVVDDTYNANADSMIAAIRTLNELPGKSIAILGSINELGEVSESEHRKVGKEAGRLDYLITIGNDAARYLADSAKAAGLSVDRIFSFDSPVAAGNKAAAIVQSGDAVLVKGSQNQVFSEEAIKPLLYDVSDYDRLVRQSDQWMDKKKAQFSDMV